MSKKTDYVQDNIYARFNGFKNNPNINQKAMLKSMYLRALTGMSMSRFKWHGLPDTVDERFLELTLMGRGLAVFYYDAEYGRFMALRGTGAGSVNMYDNPTEFRVYGNAMLNKTLSPKECVPIWANVWRKPDWDTLEIYSDKLAEIDRTIEIDMLTLRHPVILAANANERLTLTNAFREVQDGSPVIFGTEAMLEESLDNKIRAFDMSTSSIDLTSIMTVKSRIWNEALTLLGIFNVNDDKRERMVVEEAAGASGQVLAMRAMALEPRLQACEQINKMFDLDVSVEWNIDSGSEMPDALPISGDM